MADVALLMSIRDQMIEMTEAVKDSTEPETITDEKERHEIHLAYGYCLIAEYTFDHDGPYNQPPVSIKFWRQLRPLHTMMERMNRYIEAAQKQAAQR